MADSKLHQKPHRENSFRRIVTRLVLLAFFNQNLAFATNSIIELDFKDSQIPLRLHTILPRSNIKDVSHIEIDADKQQVVVHRLNKADELQPEKDNVLVEPVTTSVILQKGDVKNLPWEDLLKADRVKAFLLQHTAWLTPLDEDGYTLEFRGALLGGMMRKGGGMYPYPISVAPGGVDCQGRNDYAPGTIGSRFCNNNGSGTNNSGISVINKPYVPPVDKEWQKKIEQAQNMLPIGKPVYRPPLEGQKPDEQRTRKGWQQCCDEIQGGRELRSKFIKEVAPVTKHMVTGYYDAYLQIVDMALDSVAIASAGGSISKKKQEEMIVNVGIAWDEWSKGTPVFRNWFIRQDGYEKGYGLWGRGRTNSWFVRKIVTTASQLMNDLQEQEALQYEASQRLKAEQQEKIQMQKDNPVFYGEYSHFKEIHRLINTVIYPKVFEYSDPLGYDRAFVRAIDWKKTYAFEGYLQAYYPVFYGDYGQFKEIHRLINSVTYAEVFKYSDPLGYDRGFVKSIDYKKSYTFEGYLQACNPFYQDYTQLKEIHRLINSVIWPKVFEYSDPLGYDQGFVRSLADTYYKKPMKLFENYLQEHNPFYQDYTQLKEIHRLINSVIWPKVFEYSDPLGYDQGFIKSLANTYYKVPMKPFEGYMTEVFDDQVLEDWGAKNWRDVFRPEEGEPQIMQVNLLKDILKNAPKGIGLIKQGWQKAVQTYKGDLVKGLKIDKPVENKLTQELGKPYLSRDAKGLRWGDIKGNYQVRIMKPDKTSPHQSQHKQYVQVRRKGQVIGRDGKEVKPTTEFPRPSDNPEAHIPYEEWVNWLAPLGE